MTIHVEMSVRSYIQVLTCLKIPYTLQYRKQDIYFHSSLFCCLLVTVSRDICSSRRIIQIRCHFGAKSRESNKIGVRCYTVKLELSVLYRRVITQLIQSKANM